MQGVLTINPERMRHALEPLLRKYQIDAVFTGHNHNYERTHAVANLSVVSRGRPHTASSTLDASGGNGSRKEGRIYDKPGAPIHWVVGSGGADPDPTSAWKPAGDVPWVATQLFDDARESSNWGWVRVEANQSCLHVEFMDAYRRQEGLDPVWITK